MRDPEAPDDATRELVERVRLLEIAVAALQAQVGGEPVVASEAPASVRDLEATLGTYWLSRAGILALITGLAWFIGLHFGELGPLLRVLLGYGLAAVLAAVGLWFARSQRVFGHVVVGGGLAVGYFVTYTLHFVDTLRVVDSELAGLCLLALAIALITALAQRMSSETIAGVALFLGFHTTHVGHIDAFAFVSTTMLAGAAGYFFVKNRWVVVPLSSLLAVYSSHAVVVMRASPTSTSQLLPSLALLCVYFLIFVAAALLRPRQLTARVTLAFALLDSLAFVTLGIVTCLQAERVLLAPFLGVATLLLLGCAAAAHKRSSALLVETHLCGAAVAAALGIGESLQSWPRALGVAALGIAVVLAAHRLRQRALGVVGGALSAASAVLLWPSHTVAWVVAAAISIALGLALRERWLRLAGLGVMALAGLKMLVVDFAGLPTDQRILTFVVSGAVLLALSFAYTRYKDQLQRLL